MNRFIVPIALVLLSTATHAQNRAQCWYAYITPEGYTVQCRNGYWVTYEGGQMVAQGAGIIDPNASARGSTIVIDPATGGPSLKGDSVVTGPGNMPMEAPHQAPLWGQQPLQTR